MSQQLNFSNPFFYDNLSSERILQGDIIYNKSYPFIDLENQILNAGDIESEIDNITLLDAKKRAIKYPLLIGFYFQTSISEQHIDTTSGKAVFYVYDPSGVGIISKGSDGGINRYSLYLKKNDKRIPETVELANDDDDYMGELDYVTLSIKDEDIEKIREMSQNLDENIDSYTGANKPDYMNGTFERERFVGSGGNDDFHTIEYYFYVWEEINSPWFHNNGRIASLTPYIEQISNAEGRLNCDGTNIYVFPTNSANNTKIGNPQDDREGYKLYTQNNTTGDFIADTSSNYIKIYRLIGSNTAAGTNGLPINNSITILAPKYSRFYFMWSYRINYAGKLILHDFPEDTVTGLAPREMLIQGTFPFFTPGINISQLDLEFLAAEFPQGGIRPLNNDHVPWTFSYISLESYGSRVEDYATTDVIRQFKPKRQPIVEYLNQNLKITIPSEDIKDLSQNFIDRFNPFRETPRFKTIDGDIYIHPFENNQILYCSYNIYIFKDKPQQPVENDEGEQFMLYGERGKEVESETISYTLKMNPRVNDFVIPFNRMTIQELENDGVENPSELTFIQGNRYIIDLSNEELNANPVGLSTRDIEPPEQLGDEFDDWPDYKLGVTTSGIQGIDGQLVIDVTDDAPRLLYLYNKRQPNLSITINVVTSNEESRTYTNTDSSYPYIDKYTKVNFDEKHDISDNLLKIIYFPNSNFDFFDVPLQERGDWAFKDASGGNASKLFDDDRENAMTEFENDIWFGLEEYSPDDVQILRPFLVDLKTYPYHVHILNTPVGSGWSSMWKTKQTFPETNQIIVPILSNGEYYVRWSYTYHRYRYDKTRRFDPRYVTFEDISFNNGLSPYSYFDFREFGVIFPPKELEMEYSRIELPNEPGKYYKNLRLTIPGEQLQNLERNIIFNTDLGAEISLQFYVMKPKNRMDRDQNDPPVDFSANIFEDYDISFNLQAQYGARFPMVSYVDISDNGIKETTLKPGRYYAIWSYTVVHSFINPFAREYPLIPVVDYYTTPVHIDISYNEFLYNNMEPRFKAPDDLSRLQIEISGNDIQGIINMWERYYKGLLSDQTYIEFWILLYSPNFEHTQLLSGQNRWELPENFTGDQDIRIYQTPVEYEDNRTLTPINRVWLGNDNSDSRGAIYNWGYGGEPGIQFRKATYEDISNNELYKYKYGILDISSGDVNIPSRAFELSEVLQIDAEDISNTNFMIELTIPARTEEYDEYSAYWGFSNDPEGACDTDQGDVDSYGNFHIGINGNGADTRNVDKTTFKQECFIYKPPFEPDIRTTQENYVRYRLDHTIENVLRYHFIRTPTRGFKDGVQQTGQQDVIIYLNGEMIYDFPDWGVTFDQITHIGQNYDASKNPIRQNRIEAKFLFPISNAKQILMNDISNTSVLINTLVPQDFDEDDTEPAFYESQNYITDGLYVPFISRWFYKIRDPVSEQYLESTILQTAYPNEYQRMADWQIYPTEDGGSEIVKSPQFPFENFYRYGVFYSIPRDFIAPKPFYPTQELDLSFNRVTKDLIVTFDYDRIVYPLLFNLHNYWRHRESLTTLTYYIYAWYPYSDKLPENYSDVTDIADYHLWEDVYDISFAVTSPSPYHVANILPSIPYNVYTIGQEHLVFGKWVFAWNYKVENDAYRSLDRQRPDYIFFDVSASEIHIPPILYDPGNPLINYLNKDEYEGNEQIKITISQKEILDLSHNVMHQLKGLLDVSGVRVNFYLWTPNREVTFDPSGWELPSDFYGKNDQRLYGAPVLYEEEKIDSGVMRSYFDTPTDGEYGYRTSKALKKSVFIDISGGDFMDASCVYFTAEEINSLETEGKVIYTDKHKKFNLYNIPYICRWSFEIVRNGLPNYYSDISDNDYYRGPYFEVTTDDSGNEMIPDYNKINRYMYSVLYVDAPIEEPTVIIFDDEGLCSCPENEKSITKTAEQQNYKMRIKTMLENFRFAARLRPRPASLDSRARDYSGNFVFRYKNDPCF